MAIIQQQNFDSYALGTYPDVQSNWLNPSTNGAVSTRAVVNTHSREPGGRSLLCSFTAGANVTPGSTTLSDYTTANSAYRSELQSYVVGSNDTLKFPGEVWFSTSYFVPAPYVPVGNGYDEMIMQFHCGFGTPSIILAIRDGFLGLLRLHQKRAAFNSATNAITDDGTLAFREFGIWFPLCRLPVGRWFDVAIRRKASSVDGAVLGSETMAADGEIDVYVNGQLLHRERNVRTHLNFWTSSGVFLEHYYKSGLYIPAWNPSNWSSVNLSRFNPGESRCLRRIYVDAIKIGDANSSVAEMSPGSPLESSALEQAYFTEMNGQTVTAETAGGISRWPVPDGTAFAVIPGTAGGNSVDVRTITARML